MNELYMWIGIALLAIALIDFIWTTLWVEGGAGPVTNTFSNGVWRVMKGISMGNSSILSLAGPLILVMTIIIWVIMFWAGWTLIFASQFGSLFNTQNGLPADFMDHIYFTGYVFFTLGNGEIVPNGDNWKILTTLATGTGMFSITFAVTYLLSVLSAVTQKRAFAQSVSGVGKSGTDIVTSAWNGRDLHNLDLLLNSFSTELSKLTAQHQAYPILHHYHSINSETEGVVAVSTLDEALTLIEKGVHKKAWPNALLLKETRSSVEDYLNTLNGTFIRSSKHAPPVPDLAELNKEGIPVVGENEFQAAVEQLSSRRKKLLGLIEDNKSNWPGS
ncbi:membrane protein [Jeotgalibacillus alimentarius]|uniref:Membrane protein n=1 Tax=Jeotgalibacillus alimentarius TaxID=135826 RepID=A0A0C2VS18_9BACL|nr:potassium channel family protein [Jeotgalibacillus alimentarius]KIL51722.1 membrane protein [Jeotgalibacillus alimentarius]